MRKSIFVAAILIAAVSGGFAASSGRERQVGTTGSIPSATPGARMSEPPWSGLSGASGDPRMSAAAIRSAADNFHHCIESLWPLAARRHVSRATFERYTQALTPDLSIMDLLDNQPEFTKSLWDYLDILVNDARIEKGRALLQKYRADFEAAERTYGVDRYIVAAIWGVESNYGTQGGGRPVLRSTATLACVGRRQSYFRGEFIATLEILQHHDIPAERLVGSWAGAFGPTQFMPTAFLRYAVDFDRDGHRDVVDSVPDIIASTANNLRRMVGSADRPGVTKLSCRRTSILCSPAPVARCRSVTGNDWGSRGRTASRSRIRTNKRFCWCRPACRGPVF
jgi:membrane-bound lytic murein transglycosylase B